MHIFQNEYIVLVRNRGVGTVANGLVLMLGRPEKVMRYGWDACSSHLMEQVRGWMLNGLQVGVEGGVVMVEGVLEEQFPSNCVSSQLNQ
jgi:hypothetical protein